MFSLSTCLAFSTWLCLCPYHTHAVSASTSRQRLQSLLSLSSYSSSVIPESKEYTDWPPVGGSGQSNDGNRSETVNSYHQFYQTFYGTPEAVNNLERTYGPTGREKVLTTQNIQQKLEDVRRANDHFLKIRSRAECKTPRPQVVRVKDYYPDISKYYVPHCTILHRCSDETGCCEDGLHRCGPLQVEDVTLYFYTLHLKGNGMRTGWNNAVEKLLFINHTQCECQPINNRPRIRDNPLQPITNNSQFQGHPSEKRSKCQECPVPFYRREYPDGRCSCDCFDRQKPCLRIKRGRDAIADIERRCVLAGYCHIPDCEYGPYDATSGKCPKRPEDYTRKKPHERGHSHHYHRWAFFERD